MRLLKSEETYGKQFCPVSLLHALTGWDLYIVCAEANPRDTQHKAQIISMFSVFICFPDN